MILGLIVEELNERLSVLLNASATVLNSLTTAHRFVHGFRGRDSQTIQESGSSDLSPEKLAVRTLSHIRLYYEGNLLPCTEASLIEHDIVDGTTVKALVLVTGEAQVRLAPVPATTAVHVVPVPAVPEGRKSPEDQAGSDNLEDLNFPDSLEDLDFIMSSDSDDAAPLLDPAEAPQANGIDDFDSPESSAILTEYRPRRDGPHGLFEAAAQQLELRAVPLSLPCRQEERAQVRGFLEKQLEPRGHGNIFLTGIPGTGKTATVREVIGGLRDRITGLGARYIEVNAMGITQPAKFFEAFAKELSPRSAKALRTKAGAMKVIEGWMQKAKAPCILLLDEIDRLVNGRGAEDVMYDLLNWTTSHLILIGISNTMDIVERLQARIISRFGCRVLEFKAYTRAQLSEIISDRISHLGLFEPAAIDFASRNIVRISGDARRALEICRSAVLVAQAEYQTKYPNPADAPKERVSADDIDRVLEEAGSSVTVKALQSLPFYQRLMICAVLRLKRISPEAQISRRLLFDRFEEWLRLHRLSEVDSNQIEELLVALCVSRLLTVSPPQSGSLLAKVEMVIPEDDVSAAYVNQPAFAIEYQWISGRRPDI